MHKKGYAISQIVRPIHKPEDLKGPKIRVMEGDIYAIFKLLGASPYLRLGLNLYMSSTKVVDGQENPS